MRGFKVKAAVAYKEFMNSLSDISKNRLKEAGLLRKIHIKRNQKRLLPETQIKKIYWGKDDLSYYPNVQELETLYENPKHFERARRAIAKGMQGKKTTDDIVKEQVRMGARAKLLSGELGKIKRSADLFKGNPTLRHDALRHEKMERLSMKEGIVPKGTKIEDKTHQSYKVPLEDLKNYHQTGGSFFRNKKENVVTKRKEDTPEIFEALQNTIRKDKNNTPGRIRNRHYKKAWKDLDKKDAN